MMVLILISLFLCVFLRFVFIIQSESTDNWGHLSMVRSRKSLQSPFNYQAVNSVVKGKMAYPQFFHYLVNLLFYNNIILGGQLLNIFFDCIIVLISIFLTYYFFDLKGIIQNELYIAYVGIIVATSPILLPINARIKAMGARIFGNLLFLLFLILAFLILNTNSIHEIAIYAVGIILILHIIVLSSKFATQITIWTSIILSIFYLNIWFFLILFISLISMWKFNRFGTRDVLSSNLAHLKWHHQNIKNDKYVKRNRCKWTDHLKLPLWLLNNLPKLADHCLSKSVLIITLFSVLPFYLLIFLFIEDFQIFFELSSEPLSKFLILSILAAASASFITSFKPFHFLGVSERYFEYIVPAIAILYVFSVIYTGKSQLWLLYIVIFQLIIFLINFIYINRSQIKFLKYKDSGDSNEILDFLKKKNSLKIISVPTKLSFYFHANLGNLHKYYFMLINVPDSGLEYMNEDHPVTYNFIKPDFTYFNKKYGIDTVIISKKHMAEALRKGIKYDTQSYKAVFDNDDYIVLSI